MYVVRACTLLLVAIVAIAQYFWRIRTYLFFVYQQKFNIEAVNDYRSSLKTGPAGARKNCPRYHCSWHWSIFSLLYQCNDHIWQIQPVGTLLRVLKGQTLVPFNLGWRLPFRVFFYRNRHIKTVNESKSTWLEYVCQCWVIIASAAILV